MAKKVLTGKNAVIKIGGVAIKPFTGTYVQNIFDSPFDDVWTRKMSLKVERRYQHGPEYGKVYLLFNMLYRLNIWR